MKKNQRSYPPPSNSQPTSSQGCVGCGAYKDQINMLMGIASDLRAQNKELHDRNLAMAGDASDRYHRLKLTEQAHLNSGVIDGVMPRDAVMVDEDAVMDDFMNGFLS